MSLLSRTPWAGVLSLGLALTTAFAAPQLSAQDEATALKANKVHLVRPSGLYLDLPEQGSDLSALLLGGGGGQPKPFYEMTEQLLDITVGDGKHVLLDLSGSFSLNGPQLTEVARCLREIKDTGRTLWAYLEGAGTGHLQLAALCDHVMMADIGGLEISSPSMSVMFMKDALDLLGVRADVVRCGDFKGAVEPYMLSQMSSHLREHYVAMLEHINAEGVQRIAAGRNLSTATVRDAQSQRLFTAREAKELGFVDELVPWQGAKKALAKVTGADDLIYENALEKLTPDEEVNPIQLLTQMLNPKKEKVDVEFDSVVVMHLQGAIIDGTSASPGSIVSGPTVDLINNLIEDDSAKAVVVRINSPGGSATASEAILLALRELAAKKPVVISMGRVAASGGYYVTCIGRPILVEESTITGSIGVFSMRQYLGPLMRRVGLHEELVGLDEGADMVSMTQPWSDEAKGRMQAFVDNIYDVFTSHVARSRDMTVAEVLKIAGGRVWSGQQAIDNGLADRIGGVYDAVEMVAAEAGLDADDYEITHLPKPKSFFESFAESMAGAQLFADDPAIKLAAKQLKLDRALRLVLDGLERERPTQVWALMPEVLQIR
jgi:protease-4